MIGKQSDNRKDRQLLELIAAQINFEQFKELTEYWYMPDRGYGKISGKWKSLISGFHSTNIPADNEAAFLATRRI